MSGPCSMCVHFSLAEDAKMRAGGWGICGLGSDIAGHYQSQAAACQFEPSRFEAWPRWDTRPAPKPCDDLPEEIDFG